MARSLSETTLTFVGAAGTVTGSGFLLESASARLLVEAGLYQGRKELRLLNWEPFPVDPASIDAVVLSHAHLDHCGYLPRLVAGGFRGPVFATSYTAALAGIILRDSAHIQEEDAARANRRGYTRHAPALPLYTAEQAETALRLFRPLRLGHETEVAPGMLVVPTHAGHILGAASLSVRVTGPSPVRVVFSGDLGRDTHPLLDPPDRRSTGDAVVLEATYGARLHDDVGALDDLAGAISRTVGRGGTVVIPAYAVDRTEVVLVQLARLAAAGRIPELPVFVDSPMALDALRLYRNAVRERGEGVRDEALDAAAALSARNLVEVREVEASKAIDRDRRPKIVVSASGMATGGRVLHHLARFLPDSRSTVILVGFQSPGTRGHSLEHGATELKMFGTFVDVAAEIVSVPSLSVHADRGELIAWLTDNPVRPSATYLVHAEPEDAEGLAARLRIDHDWHTETPERRTRVALAPRAA